MLMSPHTHVALTYAREQELSQRLRHAHSVPPRDIAENTASVGRLRRRLAQLHLVALPQS